MHKFNMKKLEHATNDESVNNVVSTVSNENKRQFKKKQSTTIKTRNSKKNKNLRDSRRIQVKEEVKIEHRTVVPTNRDWLKNECKHSHDV